MVKLKGMRATSINRWRKSLLTLVIVAGWFLAGASLSSAATKAPTEQAQAVPQAPIDFTRLQFSPGLLDIVRMAKANVNPEVIRNFVIHSSVAYHPSAQEVIALKKLGVANEIIVALLNHRSQALNNPQLSSHQMMRIAEPQEMTTSPWSPYGGAYPPSPYPAHAFPLFGSLTSFNNSFPTFISGRPVYSGYYLQTYPIFW